MEGISHEAASLAGHLGLEQADRHLRRQPHQPRRADRASPSPRTCRPASRPTAGTSCASRTATTSTAIDAALTEAATPRRAADADRLPHAHRLRRAPQAGHLGGPRRRRSARTRSRPPSERTAGPRTPSSWCPTRSRAWRDERDRAAGRRSSADWQRAVRRPTRPRTPTRRPSSSASWRGRLPDGWEAALPVVPEPASRSPRAPSAGKVINALAARGARARRRLRRPLDLDQHDPQGRSGIVEPRRLPRAQPPLRRPRARDGRDHQRHGRPRRAAAVRRDVPHLLRLHEDRRSGSPR